MDHHVDGIDRVVVGRELPTERVPMPLCNHAGWVVGLAALGVTDETCGDGPRLLIGLGLQFGTESGCLPYVDECHGRRG